MQIRKNRRGPGLTDGKIRHTQMHGVLLESDQREKLSTSLPSLFNPVSK